MYNNNIELLKSIVENVIDGILVIDQEGVILLVNPSVCTLFGYSADELLGKNISMLMPAPDKHNHNKHIKRYKLTGQSHIIGIGREIMGITKNGSIFPARLAVSETKYNDEVVYAGVIHDLSEEKKAEEKLKQHTNDLETVVQERTTFLKNIVDTLEQAKEEVNTSLLKEREVNQLKTRFVSMASHEFRTPLSSILLSASLIEYYFDRLEKDKIFLHLGKIKSGVSRLTEIINDFLSIEKIEIGKVKPVLNEFDLVALCNNIADGMRLQLKEGQELIYHHFGTNPKVTLDSNLLQHCLLNLTSNAIKYSGEDGLIELTSEIDDHVCRIKIKDNGIGIPQEDQEHLFEAFFRAGNTNDIQGTGLGLNIVKRYTDLMNGTIDFESSTNLGTTFTLKFPVNP
ncbi:MAG: PAS domain-containing sensor histidine kinase [Mucilaginibacter sp.]